VASYSLSGEAAFARVMRPGRYGAHTSAPPGVVLTRQASQRVAHVAARRGAEVEVAEKLRVAGLASCELSAGQWLAIGESDFVPGLAAALSGAATVIDMSSAREIVRNSGAKARDVLAKGCPLDLDARVFAPGRSATTEIEHIACTLRQVDASPAFDLIVARSLAESFYEWLSASAAPYGYEVALAQRA
jgi:sarcosine oxidase subunit gamma